MRVFIFIVITIGCLVGASPSKAVQPATLPPVVPIVEFDQLAELGKSIAAIRYESHNAFIYAERAAALRKIASSFEGGQIEVVASVMRVNREEVFIEVEPAGKTRLVLMHSALPIFGNLRTVTYPGASSTRRLHMFSAPVGLRIGSEIKLDVAKTLRRRDRLVIRGTIASMPVWIESVFSPDTVALISDWEVREVIAPKIYTR